jgi:hypothetical protein
LKTDLYSRSLQVRNWQHGLLNNAFRAWRKYIVIRKVQIKKVFNLFRRWYGTDTDKEWWFFNLWEVYVIKKRSNRYVLHAFEGGDELVPF